MVVSQRLVFLRQVCGQFKSTPLKRIVPSLYHFSQVPKSPQCWGSFVRLCSTQVRQSEQLTMETESNDATERLNSLSPELEKKLKVIKLEYEVMLHMSETVAENMTDSMWLKLLDCETRSARRRLHLYFRKNEKYALARERKKIIKQQQHEEKRRAIESGEIEKATSNTIFLRLRKSTMIKYHNSRLANAMMYGFPLIFDLGFEESMNKREIMNLSEQLMQCHGFNKVHKEPFHLMFCNAKQNCETVRCMQSQSLTLPINKFMFTLSEQSYLDLFPRHQLVYLTPNAPNVMGKYDHEKVYIIGGLVDKSNPKPLTMAKAKREGIRMEKLPLDYFNKWEKGTKSLTLDQMVRIMLDIQYTQDWNKAFKHLPLRKIAHERGQMNR